MHDIKYIRENFENFKKKISKRNNTSNIDDIIELDKKNRKLIQEKENLEKEKKDISKSKDEKMFKTSKEISLKIKNALNKNLSNKFFFGKDFNICRRENSFIQYQDHLGEIIIPEPNLLGDHQLGNISTSIAASRKLFNVKDDHIKKGVTKIELKGRLQEINSGKLKKSYR